MNEVLFEVELKDEKASSIFLHPYKPMALVGSDMGKIFPIDLNQKKTLHYIQFFSVNDVGEKVPIASPIIELHHSPYGELVYAFTEIGAYCIEIGSLVQIAEIPMDEPVVSGTVNKNTGDVAILSQSGYLSKWAPKFHSRHGYFELDHEFTHAKIYFISEHEILISDVSGLMFRCNFHNRQVTTTKSYPKAGYVGSSSFLLSNNQAIVYLRSNGTIVFLEAQKPNIMDLDPLVEQQSRIPKIVPQDVSLQSVADAAFSSDDAETEFHLDKRLRRESKDKLLATTQALSENRLPREVLMEKIEDHELLLHQAFQSYFRNRQTAHTSQIIIQICHQKGFDPNLAAFAWKLHGQRHDGLFSFIAKVALDYDHKQAKIRNYMIVIAVLTLLSATIVSLVPQPNSLATPWVIVLATCVGLTIFFSKKVGEVNRLPRYSDLSDYLLARLFFSLFNLLLLFLFVGDTLLALIT